MGQRRGMLAVLMLTCWAGDLRAQFPFLPPAAYGGYSTRFGFARFGRHYGVGGYISGGYGYGYYPAFPMYGPFVSPFNNQITIINVPSTPIVVSPPVTVNVTVNVPQDRQEVAARDNFDDLDPDKFDVIKPRPRKPFIRAKPEPEDQDKPRDPPRVEQPRPKEKPRKPEPAPVVKEPEETNPVARARKAFALMEHGRAERLLRQVVATNPNDPQGYFLLSQVQFALTKYQEAVGSIHAGMRLQKDWPDAPFRIRELFEPDPEEFSQHLKRLEAALERYPGDAILLFLYGHQLWFDGRKDKARALFQRARPLTPDKSFIDRFLVPGPVLSFLERK